MFTNQLVQVCLLAALPLARSLAIRQEQNEEEPRYTLPDLGYEYDALEPHISARIMELHHGTHHQAFVTNLNRIEPQFDAAETVEEKLALQSALNFNGGGHINHSQYWKILAPPSSGGGSLSEDSTLSKALTAQWGSIEDFKSQFQTSALAIQGSGWAWLAFNNATKGLEVQTTEDQDVLKSPYHPVMGVDMWEHSWYLQHGPTKANYVEAIWNVINYEQVEAYLNETPYQHEE